MEEGVNCAACSGAHRGHTCGRAKDTTRTTTEEEEQQLKVTPMRVTVQEEEEEEEQQPKIATTKLASTPLKGAATRVTVQEQDNDEPTTTNLSATKTNLTGTPLRFKQLPSASTESTPAALASAPPKGPATRVAITTAAATTTTSERTPLKELVNVEVEGQDRTAKISLRDNVNSSQDLEAAFLTNDLEKIVAEEEGCAKIVDIMVDHVNEARTVNSLVLPSTWLLDDDGSTLISPNGKRYPKYIQQQQQSNLMSEIKKSYRDDYAKMVAHAHNNIGIGNGNGFRLATAEEKVFCTTSHRTNPDPDFVVKAYPDDWKFIVNVFDTKKKAVAKLFEMQK
ncbi:hypothetical protein TrLO_g9591 [Triparma laevis f. longispina]|uniref:Uncharacterized protein n=1 Tax=Triparma laevis f. longispina TaxID=1714387 RepID=A0A9W7F3N6_9STRA|nr:hypothetical protein TrLO_g9591 [Triparma laevis f. longispina]